MPQAKHLNEKMIPPDCNECSEIGIAAYDRHGMPYVTGSRMHGHRIN